MIINQCESINQSIHCLCREGGYHQCDIESCSKNMLNLKGDDRIGCGNIPRRDHPDPNPVATNRTPETTFLIFPAPNIYLSIPPPLPLPFIHSACILRNTALFIFSLPPSHSLPL